MLFCIFSPKTWFSQKNPIPIHLLVKSKNVSFSYARAYSTKIETTQQKGTQCKGLKNFLVLLFEWVYSFVFVVTNEINISIFCHFLYMKMFWESWHKWIVGCDDRAEPCGHSRIANFHFFFVIRTYFAWAQNCAHPRETLAFRKYAFLCLVFYCCRLLLFLAAAANCLHTPRRRRVWISCVRNAWKLVLSSYFDILP